jgi:hypothetical protein
MANNSDVNNVILGYDKNMRDNYNLFSFLDESQNEYNGVGKYNDKMTDFLNNFKPYVLSESNPKCNITTEDKDNYDFKINALESIINKCNATTVQNKQKCLYDEFMKEPTIVLVKDLTAIVKKINNDCIFGKITSENVTNICRDNSNNILNNYTNDKILLTRNFLNKYTSIISDLKKISDTNNTAYLTKCNQDPARIKTYNDTQQLLANALIAINPSYTNPTSECKNTTSECIPEKVCTQSVCTNQIGIKTQISDLNNQIKSLKDNSTCPSVTNDLLWNSELSMRNGFVISCIIIFLIIVIIILIVLIAKNSNKSSEYNMTSVTSSQ